MNTADRSIALIDAAMRRRFAFVELDPRIPPVQGLLAPLARSSTPAAGRGACCSTCSTRRLADSDAAIGPSYLMKRRIYQREDGLDRVWQYEIMPLLEDLFYGQRDLDRALRPAPACARPSPPPRRTVTHRARRARPARRSCRSRRSRGGCSPPRRGHRRAVRPTSPGAWQVGPAGKVGAARIGDMRSTSRPKVPIARLLFLLGYALHGGAWRPETVPVAEAPDLVPASPRRCGGRPNGRSHQGLLPGYVLVEESSQVLRGRLRESEQLRRHHGLPLPLEIRHDEFTVDIPENQILRTACERMLAVPRVDAESQRMLRRLLRDFSDVTPLPRGEHDPRLAGDPAQRPLPRGAAAGRTGPARDLRRA